ncbi:hypothetical protein ACW9HQ_30975 [Nocardia gipuzkoensis]
MFDTEHPILDYETGQVVVRKFDPDPEVADAWIRLRSGNALAEDHVLLEHELAELNCLRANPGGQVSGCSPGGERVVQLADPGSVEQARRLRKWVVSMAAIVYFAKESESPEVVVYEFGDDPGTLTRKLAMDKASRTAQPVDGNVDYTFLKASRKINSVYSESNAWPERGMSVS